MAGAGGVTLLAPPPPKFAPLGPGCTVDEFTAEDALTGAGMPVGFGTAEFVDAKEADAIVVGAAPREGFGVGPPPREREGVGTLVAWEGAEARDVGGRLEDMC